MTVISANFAAAAESRKMPNYRYRDLLMKTFEEALAVADAAFKCDVDMTWRAEDGQLRASINDNDVFGWGCADSEDVEYDDLPLLQRAYDDLHSLSPHAPRFVAYTDTLFVSRKRGMRPQGKFYKHLPKETWPLFDAAGPVREATLGEPEEVPA